MRNWSLKLGILLLLVSNPWYRGVTYAQGGNGYPPPALTYQQPTGTQRTSNLPGVPASSQVGPNQVAPNQVGPPDGRVAANPLPNTALQASSEPTKESAIPVRNLLQIFHDGGVMMYPIALCSFILTVFAFERLIHLRIGRVIPRPFVNRLIEQLQQQQVDREEALELCERNPSPMATILSAAVKRYGKSAVEIEQAVLDAGERESNQLRRYMRLLSAISNVAPLLGMLGTVLGMIQSFNDISGSAMGRPEMLAGGISTALLTTAFGLMVSIPAYLLYIYFLGRTDRLTMEMDSYAQRVVEIICAEGLQDSRSRSRARKAA
ncbi:MAG: MotA/TolQ/ExbB proton channel family protein [Pirellula sp.]